MNIWFRKLRGAVSIGLTWGVMWAGIGAALSIVIGIVDPGSIDAGEGPLRIGAILGTVGVISGTFFSVVLSFAERRKQVRELSLLRAAAWGIIGAAIFPLLTPMNNSILLNVCPLGALFATASVALARRAELRAPEARRELLP